MQMYMKGKLVTIDATTEDETTTRYYGGVGRILGYAGKNPKDEVVNMVRIKVLYIHCQKVTYGKPDKHGSRSLIFASDTEFNHPLKQEEITLPATELHIGLGYSRFDHWLEIVWEDLDYGGYGWEDRPTIARIKHFFCLLLHDHPWGDEPY